MLKQILKKVRGFSSVELVIMVGFGALAAAALIYLGTTPHYMASSTQPVNVNVKVDGSGSTVSRTAGASADTIGNVWIVDEAGNGDYTDIQSAVDAASDGDMIMVMDGTYDGVYIEGKSVKIVGSGSGTLINNFHSNSDWLGDGITIYGPGTAGTEISNLTIDLSGATLPAVRAPIDIWVTNNITVQGVEIKNTTYAGIYARSASGLNITHNKFSGTAPRDYFLIQPTGIGLFATSDSLVAFNDIEFLSSTEGGQGIIIASSSYRNKVINNKIAVKIKGGANPFFSDAGVFILAFRLSNISLFPSDNLIVGFNDFRGSEDPDGNPAYVVGNTTGSVAGDLFELNTISQNIWNYPPATSSAPETIPYVKNSFFE